MGAAPWAVGSEIFPLHVIGTANSLAATTNWVMSALVAELFKLLTEISLTSQVCCYVAMAVFAIANFAFAYYLVPETANRTIEENLVQILGAEYK